jgi:hypothetical protein
LQIVRAQMGDITAQIVGSGQAGWAVSKDFIAG